MEELEAFVSKSFAGQDMAPTEPNEEQKRAAASIRKCTEWLSLIQGTPTGPSSAIKKIKPGCSPKNKTRSETVRNDKDPLESEEAEMNESASQNRKRTGATEGEEEPLTKRLRTEGL